MNLLVTKNTMLVDFLGRDLINMGITCQGLFDKSTGTGILDVRTNQDIEIKLRAEMLVTDVVTCKDRKEINQALMHALLRVNPVN